MLYYHCHFLSYLYCTSPLYSPLHDRDIYSLHEGEGLKEGAKPLQTTPDKQLLNYNSFRLMISGVGHFYYFCLTLYLARQRYTWLFLANLVH